LSIDDALLRYFEKYFIKSVVLLRCAPAQAYLVSR